MKKQLLLLVLLLLPMVASAFRGYAEIDGINYYIDTDYTNASVIKKSSGSYSGNIVIPATVEYEGVICNVKSVDYQAFSRCYGLTSITIPSSVTYIGENAFSDCSGLTAVHISDIKAWLNITFTTFTSNPLNNANRLFLNEEEVKELVIPNGVTDIGKYAFVGCSGLTSVTIPESVKSIGEWGFSACNGLTAVHISDLKSWCEIEFYDDNSNPLKYAKHLLLNGNEIKDLLIPNSVKKISKNSFSGCSGLTSVTIPESVTSIGERAFSSCSGLTSVYIPNSITNIEDGTFGGCSSLSSVDIPNSVTSIGQEVFYGCKSLETIVIPEGVTVIKYSTFRDCTGLKKIVLPNSVTSIEAFSFSNCTSLISITFPSNLSIISGSSFEFCKSLASLVIPESVVCIDCNAFKDCTTLYSVTIPQSVSKINSYAFLNCYLLTDVYCYANTLPTTDSNAFKNCSLSSATLHVPAESVSLYQQAEPWSGFKSIVAISGETPEIKKCANPTITYTNGEIVFNCETDGVEYISQIKAADDIDHYDGKIVPTNKYIVTVYATKTGYDNSDVVTGEITIGGSGTGIKGDVNEDGTVDVADVVDVVNIILDK